MGEKQEQYVMVAGGETVAQANDLVGLANIPPPEGEGHDARIVDEQGETLLEWDGVQDWVPVQEWDGGQRLVLEALGLENTSQNDVILVTCKVVEFTVGSKIRPAEYEMAEGTVTVVPENLKIHVPIRNPAQVVTDTGDAGIFGLAFQTIARELDLRTFQIASQRMDLRVSLQQANQERASKKTTRIQAGTPKERGEPKENGTVL